jgi:hypothetical protein
MMKNPCIGGLFPASPKGGEGDHEAGVYGSNAHRPVVCSVRNSAEGPHEATTGGGAGSILERAVAVSEEHLRHEVFGFSE